MRFELARPGQEIFRPWQTALLPMSQGEIKQNAHTLLGRGLLASRVRLQRSFEERSGIFEAFAGLAAHTRRPSLVAEDPSLVAGSHGLRRLAQALEELGGLAEAAYPAQEQ